MEGGTGIRKFSDLNTTARLTLLWNLLKTQSLWSKWMKTQYLPMTNFCVLPVNNNFSGTMKSILRQLDLAANIMSRIIVNGDHIDLWYDPWINHKSLVDLIGWNSVSISNTDNSKVR